MSAPESYGRQLSFGYVDVLAQYYNISGNTHRYIKTKDYLYREPYDKEVLSTIWSRQYKGIANLNAMLMFIDEQRGVFSGDEVYRIYKGEILALLGENGSGKTTLTEHLVSRFGDDIAVVHHDNYYKRQDCSFEERCKQNYDHPDAFDTDLMIQDLKKLKAGQTIYCPVYDYALHNRTDQTVEIRPAKVVIVEGILIFQNKELRDLLDIKIFVETDADVRILRRALRDVEERGRSMQSVVTQYLTTVKPMHEQFVEPTRKYADIVVLEGGHNLVALDLIMQRIANHIAEN